MGCASSKQSRRAGPTLPSFRRSSGTVHAGGDTHVVTLTFSTLGSLNLDYNSKTSAEYLRPPPEFAVVERSSENSPPAEPPSEPELRPGNSRPPSLSGETEVINSWELMDGLDDDAASRSSNFDSELLSAFNDAIDEHSQSPSQSPEEKQSVELHFVENKEEERNCVQEPTKSIVRARIEAFQQKIDAKRAKIKADSVKVAEMAGAKGKIVVYFTSLRGVRKTFEDCWTVKMILKSYGFRIDERDVSMHSGFKEELVQLLGSVYGRGQLPRVFAGGKYLGGADEVRQLHEAGELFRKLEGCEMMAVSAQKVGVEVECQGCGDARFVPCEACSGSCKLYVEEGDFVEFGSFRRCPDCNENGLVRCPLCCY